MLRIRRATFVPIFIKTVPFARELAIFQNVFNASMEPISSTQPVPSVQPTQPPAFLNSITPPVP